MPEFAPHERNISRLEHRIISVDCSGDLESDETIVGTPDVTEFSTNHLGISNVQVSGVALTINGETVPAGQAIQFMVDARGGAVLARRTYTLHLEFDTTTGQRVAGGIRLKTVD